jgi:transposase
MKDHRKRYSAEFKAKVALEAIREQHTIGELAQRFGAHPNQIYKWKRQVVERVASIFAQGESQTGSDSGQQDELLKKIGELTVERDFLARGLGRIR